MKKIDIVSIAFGNFKRRKTRSILTVLGVVIGVASIVSMISLGIAVNMSFKKSIEGIGDLTTVTVYPSYDHETGKQIPMGDDIVAQLSAIDHVTAVSPELRLNGKLVAGKYVAHGNMIGVTSAYMDKLGFKAEKGTLEGLSDSSGKTIHCVFGAEVPYQFYNPKSNKGGGMMYDRVSMEGERPLPEVDVMDENTRLRFTFDWSYGEKFPGQPITQPAQKPKLYTLKNLALLKSDMGEKDFTVYIDIETAKKLKKEQQKFEENMYGEAGGIKKNQATTFSYDQVKVLTNNIDNTTKVLNQVKEMGLEAWSSSEYIQSVQEQMKIIQLVLGGIGSVSLLVAAIGITNTMIMSIYERTREIGIMKVIGCQLKDIGVMFLCEAAFIGLFGGAVGLGLSYGISFALNTVAKNGAAMGMMGGMQSKLSVIPWWLALGAVAFAILVGLISGFFPARRAMRLSALEAMRY